MNTIMQGMGELVRELKSSSEEQVSRQAEEIKPASSAGYSAVAGTIDKLEGDMDKWKEFQDARTLTYVQNAEETLEGDLSEKEIQDGKKNLTDAINSVNTFSDSTVEGLSSYTEGAKKADEDVRAHLGGYSDFLLGFGESAA